MSLELKSISKIYRDRRSRTEDSRVRPDACKIEWSSPCCREKRSCASLRSPSIFLLSVAKAEENFSLYFLSIFYLPNSFVEESLIPLSLFRRRSLFSPSPGWPSPVDKPPLHCPEPRRSCPLSRCQRLKWKKSKGRRSFIATRTILIRRSSLWRFSNDALIFATNESAYCVNGHSKTVERIQQVASLLETMESTLLTLSTIVEFFSVRW